MSSPKQIEANRLNAKKSTGPRTPAGKAKSRFNALKAGIDAGAEAIPGEDPDDLRALRADYNQRFTPDRPEQYALVDALIANDWLLRRLRKIEGQLWTQEVGEASERMSFDPATPLACALSSVEDSLTRLQRRMDSADRAYHRALNQIRRLQQAPLAPFPPEPPVTEPADPPTSATQPAPNQQDSQPIGFVPPIPVAFRAAPSAPAPALTCADDVGWPILPAAGYQPARRA